MRLCILTLCGLSIMGCAGSLEQSKQAGVADRAPGPLRVAPATMERCADLDGRRAFYGGSAKAFAVLGGAAGLSTIPVDDKTLDTGLAIGAVVSAALAAGSVYVSEEAGNSWTRECQ